MPEFEGRNHLTAFFQGLGKIDDPGKIDLHFCHPGWFLDYGFEQFRPRKAEEDEEGKKKDDGERLGKILSHLAVPPIYGAAYDRHRASFDGAETALQEFRAASRLLAGHGIHSVSESGLKLHHTYGVPLIPGSSLKGIARHYVLRNFAGYEGANEKEAPIPAAYECGELNGAFLPGPTMDPERAAKLPPEEWHTQFTAFDMLFGRQDFRGVLTFHDAWLIPEGAPPTPFLQDVITPHHEKYNAGETYRHRGQDLRYPPADWDEPVPVPLVTVKPGCAFLVAIEGPEEWRNLAMDILGRALEREGVGAKTNAGYGRLVPTEAQPEGDAWRELDGDMRKRRLGIRAKPLRELARKDLFDKIKDKDEQEIIKYIEKTAKTTDVRKRFVLADAAREAIKKKRKHWKAWAKANPETLQQLKAWTDAELL